MPQTILGSRRSFSIGSVAGTAIKIVFRTVLYGLAAFGALCLFAALSGCEPAPPAPPKPVSLESALPCFLCDTSITEAGYEQVGRLYCSRQCARLDRAIDTQPADWQDGLRLTARETKHGFRR